ncbi:S8 family peptidase [Eubacteriales bacterium OttesenSCG-928-K08]|nr:S8 family peptidase [Eubacteriales bacterium OttesenSCG-928-K08]
MENPINNPPAYDTFFDDPNTVDLIAAYSEINEETLQELPYVRPGRVLIGGFSSMYVDKNHIDDVLSSLGTRSIDVRPLVLAPLGQADLYEAGILQAQNQPYLDLRGRGVLLGFVDTGIDYMNAAFQYEDKRSKIQYLWDQSIPGNAPEGYYFGSQYTNEQLNEAIVSDNPYSIVPSRDTVGHGTFLASVAGGRGPGEYIGAAPDADMIIVKLRKANQYHLSAAHTPPDVESAFSSADLMVGIEYILDRANRLDRPVAICIGLGTNFGGHDGFSVLEEYLSGLANLAGCVICVAAGNEVLARHHTQGQVEKSGDTKNIEIRAANNGSDINVQIWTGQADLFSAAVTSPAGETVGRIPAKTGVRVESGLALEQSRVSVSYWFPLFGSGDQLTNITIYNPTPGLWTITLHGDSVLNGTYHAWLPITGLVDPQIAFLSPSPDVTITVPATSLGIITVGAYATDTRSLYGSSSWGPTRLPLLSPDITAPGVNVQGVFPGGYGSMSGTSVAAAIATGASAQLLQWGVVENNEPSLSSYLARAYFIRGCERDAGISYPNEQWGYGRLNVYNVFLQIRG